jgi:hypothetical protein
LQTNAQMIMSEALTIKYEERGKAHLVQGV